MTQEQSAHASDQDPFWVAPTDSVDDTDPDTPEKDATPDLLSEEQFYNLLGGAGNHEAKLLTTAIITSRPGLYFSARNIYNELCDRQGQDVAWRPHDEVGLKYARVSLAPIGAVVKGAVTGARGPVEAYQATGSGEKWGLPMAGALLDWSLRHPDISLMQILGSTSTSSIVRSPEVRLKIYNELLTNPDTTASSHDIARQITSSSDNDKLVSDQLNDLALAGIVDIETVQVDYNPTLRITYAEYRHIAIPFEKLKPETRAAYDTMRFFTDEGITEINLDAFIAKAVELDPTIDAAKLRSKIAQSLHGYAKNFPGMEFVDRSGIDESKRTLVKLNDAMIEPLTELCNVLDDIMLGHNLEHYASMAHSIINNPSAFRELMGKVKRMSPNVIGQTEGREQLDKRMIGIIRAMGSATLREIRVGLIEQGRTLSVEGVRMALAPLVADGKIGFEQTARSANNKVKINRYTYLPASADE